MGPPPGEVELPLDHLLQLKPEPQFPAAGAPARFSSCSPAHLGPAPRLCLECMLPQLCRLPSSTKVSPNILRDPDTQTRASGLSSHFTDTETEAQRRGEGFSQVL